MEVKHSRSEPTSDGPEQFFSGKVRLAPLFTGGDPSRMSCACVTFDKGGMTHIAIQEALDGKVVEWMEKVTDEEYGKAAKA